MAGEDLETRVANAESRLVLRTSELERRIIRLERRGRVLAEVVTGTLAALVVASFAYWIQGETSPWGVIAMLGFFVAVVLTELYFRWLAPE